MLVMARHGRLRHALAMPETPVRPDRTLPIILSVIAALVVIAVVVVFTRGAPEQLDPSTPQGTVQQYVTAVIDGDKSAAAEHLSPTWLDDCDPLNYGQETAQLRVSLISTTESDASATVEVNISYGPGNGPFGVSDYDYDDSFRLEKTGSDWQITVAPWEFAVCPTGSAG